MEGRGRGSRTAPAWATQKVVSLLLEWAQRWGRASGLNPAPCPPAPCLLSSLPGENQGVPYSCQQGNRMFSENPGSPSTARQAQVPVQRPVRPCTVAPSSITLWLARRTLLLPFPPHPSGLWPSTRHMLTSGPLHLSQGAHSRVPVCPTTTTFLALWVESQPPPPSSLLSALAVSVCCVTLGTLLTPKEC